VSSPHFGYLEAAVVGLFQGAAELFPISSLGHSILIPQLIGGSWAKDLNVSAGESPYLAFIVGMHVATALALVAYFWRDWVRIVSGLFTSVTRREVQTADQRLAWLLIIGTIPVGLIGLLFEHTFRTTFGKPLSAALFLIANGVILYGGELLRRRAPVDEGYEMATVAVAKSGDPDRERASDHRLAGLSVKDALLVGGSEIGALFSGISRSGIAMTTGLLRGLSHEDAARFSFLLATPVILAAGVLKLPDLTGPLGNGVRGQILVGSILSGIGAYLSVRFLDRYFQTRTLTPFAIYCVIAGTACAIRFGFF